MRPSLPDLPARPEAVLFDLLMAVMDSPAIWAAAAHDRDSGLAWRDRVTERMAATSSYAPYQELVAEAAGEIGLPSVAPLELFDRWSGMQPWPDATAVSRLSLPYAFVTNCSTLLAGVAARRSGLRPRFTLSAQDAGWYKPDPRIYREACRRVNRPLDRVLFVAGSPYDARGARAAGLHVALLARRPDQRLPGASGFVANSLNEIVDAIHRVVPARP